MANEQLQFRTAAIGGFQKQDVLAYLEKSAQDHAASLDLLQRKIDELQSARRTLEEQYTADQSRLTAYEQETGRLNRELADREESLAQATAKCHELETRLANLQAELNHLTPAAAAYEGIKERTAGIELEAHSRAQAIEEESRQRARELQRQVLSWLDGMQSSYSKLRSEMSITLAQAVDRMEKAAQEVESLSGEFASQDDTLKLLRSQADSIKLPAPSRAESGTAEPNGLTPPTGPVPFTN